MPDTPSTKATQRCSLAVIMQKTRLASRWASEQWEAAGVIAGAAAGDGGERVIVQNEQLTQVLFPGLVLKLQRDEAEGYYYNITSPQPKVFVMWREEDELARPVGVTVSYHEGARWMDSEAHVDGVALPPELVPWIAEFAAEHYKPEPKKKVRYASSRDMGVASRRDGVK